MKKRILAAALCLALLSGCGARPPLDLPDAESDRAVIAYVPLDDRPDNVGRVEYLAESLGYVLNMPEEWMFKTLLDGQMEDYYAENGSGNTILDRAKRLSRPPVRLGAGTGGIRL